MFRYLQIKKYGGYAKKVMSGKLLSIAGKKAQAVLIALKKVVLNNTFIALPPHSSYPLSPSLATQTNTYFFSGGFAVKVSL